MSIHLDRFCLEGKVALVTGASSGLGTQFARALDAAGASLVLAARRATALEALARELREALVVPTDVTNVSAVDDLVSTAEAHFGRVDVLVNNAGVTDVTKALEQTDEEFTRVLEVNLTAPYHLSKRLAHGMVARGSGSIINIASVLGIVSVGPIAQAGYAASKGGLISLTRELAVQWARKGIRVNAIAPGWFVSEMNADMLATDRARAWIAEQTPMARTGEPGELDGALLFLASEASSFTTGQVLIVDGGWTIV